jgi:predicted porin
MLGATYSLGRDAVNAGSPAGTNCPGELAGDARACRERSALVKYDSPAWGAALAWDEIHGGPGAFAGLVSSAMKDTRLSANGYVKWGDLKATLGLVRRDNGASGATPRSDLWYVGGVYAVTPTLTLDGECLSLRFKGTSNQARLVALRASYSLSRRSAVYAMAGSIANGGSLALSVSAGAGGSNPAVGASQKGLTAGLRHVF